MSQAEPLLLPEERDRLLAALGDTDASILVQNTIAQTEYRHAKQIMALLKEYNAKPVSQS